MSSNPHEEGIPSWHPDRGPGDTFEEILQRRLTRRGMLKAGVVASAVVALRPGLGSFDASVAQAAGVTEQAARDGLTFTPIPPDTSDQLTVAEGYRTQVLIGWGDSLFAGTPSMDLGRQSAALQEKQFGFNCDFVAYLPLPLGSNNPAEGLLWVNHEYTDGAMMFPGYDAKNPTREQVDVELAAHGASVVHVRRQQDGTWMAEQDSPYNRRITATTPMRLSGPAAGDDMLKTGADPTGTSVVGMLNNCGGGWTPWGTVVTAEENFNQYFANADALDAGDRRKPIHARYGMPKAASERLWELFHDRFDAVKHPNEPLRYGWIVEVDPYDPSFTPIKRTALGRMKHEAATLVLASNGRVVAYMGDDERFDYVYKFVSDGTYNPNDRAANLSLLDSGTLYVARFSDDGAGVWMPMVHGQGPLTAANGWASQADVLIRTRQAADALGATKMDRPEDVEANPVNGKIYMVMTNNTQRGGDERPVPDAANPRANNAFGHILEATEDGNDYTATTFRWEVFLLGGDPSDPSTYFAGFPKDQVSPIGTPDNVTFDSRGNLWIATDGQPSSLKVNDAIHAVAVDGPWRGRVMQLLSGVSGCEVASLVFNTDDQALFVSIQHPGEGGTLAQPTSVWPTGTVAIPSVVVVTRVGGGAIGT